MILRCATGRILRGNPDCEACGPGNAALDSLAPSKTASPEGSTVGVRERNEEKAVIELFGVRPVGSFDCFEAQASQRRSRGERQEQPARPERIRIVRFPIKKETRSVYRLLRERTRRLRKRSIAPCRGTYTPVNGPPPPPTEHPLARLVVKLTIRHLSLSGLKFPWLSSTGCRWRRSRIHPATALRMN